MRMFSLTGRVYHGIEPDGHCGAASICVNYPLLWPNRLASFRDWSARLRGKVAKDDSLRGELINVLRVYDWGIDGMPSSQPLDCEAQLVDCMARLCADRTYPVNGASVSVPVPVKRTQTSVLYGTHDTGAVAAVHTPAKGGKATRSSRRIAAAVAAASGDDEEEDDDDRKQAAAVLTPIALSQSVDGVPAPLPRGLWLNNHGLLIIAYITNKPIWVIGRCNSDGKDIDVRLHMTQNQCKQMAMMTARDRDDTCGGGDDVHGIVASGDGVSVDVGSQKTKSRRRTNCDWPVQHYRTKAQYEAGLYRIEATDMVLIFNRGQEHFTALAPPVNRRRLDDVAASAHTAALSVYSSMTMEERERSLQIQSGIPNAIPCHARMCRTHLDIHYDE